MYDLIPYVLSKQPTKRAQHLHEVLHYRCRYTIANVLDYWWFLMIWPERVRIFLFDLYKTLN